MANRSYIYAFDDGSPLRDLGEWKSEVPISHLLLVSGNPIPVRSQIWSVEHRVALRGEARRGREVLGRLLDWLAPQLGADFATAKERTLAALDSPDRQGAFYHLEPGEVYELEGLKLDEMERRTYQLGWRAKHLASEVEQLVGTPGATLDSATGDLSYISRDWEQLGLYYPKVLYFHFS